MISGDSGEYEVLTKGVELSSKVDGMAVEIGLRRGLGTKTILDAVRKFCPTKRVISIDPYGSIPYVGREHIGEIRLDYTDDMKVDCMVDIWTDIQKNPVKIKYDFYPYTDNFFFQTFPNGVPKYDLEFTFDKLYSFAHIDGPHYVSHISESVNWFNERMNTGACIVIDDVTIDFIDIKPIQALFIQLGWKELHMGLKKGLWQKL